MGNKNITNINKNNKTKFLSTDVVLPDLSYKIDISHVPAEFRSPGNKNSKGSHFLFELPPILKVKRKVLKPHFEPSENISKIKKAIHYIAANAG